MIEAIEGNGGVPENVRLSGGLARVHLISQIKADVIGKEVLVLSEFETTASGAAMMVFQSQMGISFEQLAKGFSTVREIIRPNMENHRKYEIIYGLFKETYQTLRPLFEKRMAVLQQIQNSNGTQIENL